MENNNYQPIASEEFGMNEQDIKNYKLKNFWNKVKYFFAKIEPSLVRVFQTIIYWTVKFTKIFVGAVIRMITGKDV